MMPLVHLFQSVAAVASPDRFIAGVLLIGALLSAVCAWRTSRGRLSESAGGIGAVVVFSLVLLIRPEFSISPLVAAAVAVGVLALLVRQVLIDHREVSTAARPVDRQPRHDLHWIGAAALLAVILLFADLGGYPGWLMAWEPPVIDGFAEARGAATGILSYFVDCLGWDEGLVSSGHHALIYGATTYALWQLVGISTWTLRLPAALFALATLVPAWWLGRRLGASAVATVTVVVLALSPALVFYGRYGTSLSGSLLAVSAAVLACLALCDLERVRWWHGLLAGGVCFVATLGYSPGRLVVVAALALIPILLLVKRPRAGRHHWIALVLLVLTTASAWAIESGRDRSRYFVSARGEQIVDFLRHPDAIRNFLGRDLDPDRLSLQDRAELVMRVVERTVPQLGAVWAVPFSRPVTAASVIGGDPPWLPLYHPALLVFILWGLAASLTRPLEGLHPFLLGWLAALCLPVLLTTRVDAHRLMLAVVPLALWAAMGLVRAGRLMAAGGVPRYVRTGLAAALMVGAVVSESSYLFFRSPPDYPITEALVGELSQIEGPVILGSDLDHRITRMVRLALLDRARSDPAAGEAILPEGVMRDLFRYGQPARYALAEIEEDLWRATILLAPAERFEEAANALVERGLDVELKGGEEAEFWRLDRTGPPPQPAVPAAATPTPIPAPTPADPPSGRLTALDTSNPLNLSYGFAPPRVDQLWDGGPLTMGDVTYRHGIGMHAWTTMSFAVPDDSIEFAAIIGLSDRIRTCRAALVTFEVRGDADTLLFDSGLIGPETPPLQIRVPVGGHATLTLVLTEAENGRDCDHGCWADPIFLLAD